MDVNISIVYTVPSCFYAVRGWHFIIIVKTGTHSEEAPEAHANSYV